MVSHKHKFIFVHIPKTGGHSIERHFGAWDVNSGRKAMLVGQNREHFPLWKILNWVPDSAGYFKFTFVRNPWDKLVSEWKYMQKHPVTGSARNAFWKYGRTFESFVKNNLVKYSRPGHNLFQHEFIDLRINFIARFETLQEDWELICDKINIPRFELPHHNKTVHSNYVDYYDEVTRDIVAKKYAEDIRLFNYKFGQ